MTEKQLLTALLNALRSRADRLSRHSLGGNEQTIAELKRTVNLARKIHEAEIWAKHYRLTT